MSDRPAWYYDEMRQTGLDFENAEQVAAYERNQGASVEREQALIARLGIGAHHTVIDLGCGTATFAIEAARAGADAHAVDVSPAMLDYARGKAGRAGLANIAFHHAGFLTYQHTGAPADFVVTRYALHHLSDFWKMAALLRIAAMLKPGATLYLEDVVFSFDPSDYRAGVEEWIGRMAKPPGEGFTRTDFETHVRDEHSTYGWIIEGMLERAGFRVEPAVRDDPAFASYICIRAAP